MDLLRDSHRPAQNNHAVFTLFGVPTHLPLSHPLCSQLQSHKDIAESDITNSLNHKSIKAKSLMTGNADIGG